MKTAHRSFALRFLLLLLLLSGCGQATPTMIVPTDAPPEAVPTEVVISVAPETESPNYLDPSAPVAARAADLLSRMTLAEKIGQMTLVEKNSIQPQAVRDFFIGGVLSGGGGSPPENTPAGWRAMVTSFQDSALQTRLNIPMIYGVDAVHGHNNVRGAVIFPHNIGLGAAGDEALVEQIARATAEEMAATAIFWNYAPVLAVPQDIRWGRTYEGFSEQTELVTRMGAAYQRGLQGDDLSDASAVLATPKHYIGDGGTAWGSATTGNNYKIDQGVTDVDEETLRSVHLPPYEAAVAAGARSIMVSFSSWNGQRMSAQHYLLTEVLKGELGFSGFVVSDWASIDMVDRDYYKAVVASINAGIDMNMVPYDYRKFISTLTTAVERGDVPLARVDDAVLRILTVKFELGLFEDPLREGNDTALVGSGAHRSLAREAVAKSLVLLKNDSQTLPIAKDVPLILVAGAADDIGMQSGGWTIEWQGRTGNITTGTTILQGIRAAVSSDTAVEYERFGRFETITDASGQAQHAPLGIVVVGEVPYAEGQGDSDNLSLNTSDQAVLERMRDKVDRLVVIIISGRPMIITEQLPRIDALVAAWLPGSEGDGVTDVLFGGQPFTGRLSYSWPRSMDQLPFDFDNLGEGCDAPLFPYGFGLFYDTEEQSSQPQLICP